jgi:hypothetical protein
VPAFPQDWQSRLARYGSGVTVIRTPQCPYLENATATIMQSAQQLGLSAQVVELTSARQVQDSSPSPYGVFAVVWNGQLLSYFYLTKEEFEKRYLQAHSGG